MKHARPLLGATMVSLLVAALVSGSPQEPALEVTAVAGRVSTLINERGGNIGVSVGEDGVLLVDDLFAETAPAVEKALSGLSEKQPVYLVNTHWHGDHTGGNAHFGRNATIFAHTNVRRRLAGDSALGGRVAGDTPSDALPVVTFEDGLSLHFNGEEIVVFHVENAHTDGDSVVWFTGSNVVHMGDLYFEVGYPFIDLASGGDVDGVIAGVRQVLDLVPADARIIPGHGRVSGVEGLREYLAMLEGVVSRVRAALAQGKSLEEMLSEGLTADYDERWGHFDFVGPESFLRTVIECVKR